MSSKTRTNIYLDSDQYEWLREYAHQHRISMAEAVRDAVDLFSFIHATDQMEGTANLSSLLESVESQPERWWQDLPPQADSEALRSRYEETKEGASVDP